jgi:mono/diheme cytochrome c family protein
MLATMASLLVLASGAAATGVSFQQDVLPILNKHCVMCHVPGGAQGELELYPDPWTSMVGVPSVQASLVLVEPGSPEQSYLFIKLLGAQHTVGGSGEQMPFPLPLEAGQIDLIRAWIEQGAPDN